MSLTGSRIKSFVAMLLMVAAFTAAHALRPTRHLTDTRVPVKLEALFPQQFGEWRVDLSGPVQLVSPDAEALIKQIYTDTLSRTYVNGKGGRIMLSVAYGGDQSDATKAHRPEVCYPSQGFQVLSSHDTMLQTSTHSVRARQLVAKLGQRTEPISYWVVVGDRIALGSTDQKLAQLSYSLRGVIPDGMLVRVSNIDTDAQSAFKLHQDFILQLSRALLPTLAARVIGQTGA